MEQRRRRRTRVRGERPPQVKEDPRQPNQPPIDNLATAPIVREPPRAATPRATLEMERARLRMLELEGSDDLMGDGQDKFHIDLNLIPSGWSYEWKRYSVLNQVDDQYLGEMRRQGWEPVPTGRHPDLMAPGTPGTAAIIRDGLVLMERPLELTMRMRERYNQAARAQVHMKEQQLRAAPQGTFERGTHPGAPVNVTKSYAPIPVPAT